MKNNLGSKVRIYFNSFETLIISRCNVFRESMFFLNFRRLWNISKQFQRIFLSLVLWMFVSQSHFMSYVHFFCEFIDTSLALILYCFYMAIYRWAHVVFNSLYGEQFLGLRIHLEILFRQQFLFNDSKFLYKIYLVI